MKSDHLEARCWQGVFSVALWFLFFVVITSPTTNVSATSGWTLFLTSLTHTRFPLWVSILTPIPFVLFAADTLRPKPLLAHFHIEGGRFRVPLALALCLISVAVGVAALSNIRPSTDQPVAITCAAQNILQGTDPYTTYEPQCYRQVNHPPTGTTPLQSGAFASLSHYPSDAATTRVLLHDEATDQHGGFPAYGYPPEAALTVLPVAFSGWRLISLWVALCCSLLLLLIWRRRLPNQLLFLAWQLLGLSLLVSAFGWNPEYVAYLVLALSFARIDQVQVSAATLAIAVCANPLCWLAAPIYLAATHHEYAWRQRLNWFVGSCALGIIPWMIWDHHLLSQLLRFVTMPEFPLGAAIGQFSHLPNYGHAIYTLAFLLVIALATATAWFSSTWRWAMVPLVYLAFIVSWRGPLYYYLPAFWLTPAVLAGIYQLRQARSRQKPAARSDQTERGHWQERHRQL